ncbi:MAG TPA: hypothetical protein VFU09_01290 [Candidatus Udaeobacter sp.]|nr:hypothetical protein [Candidatus Udaeobacter sp.]
MNIAARRFQAVYGGPASPAVVTSRGDPKAFAGMYRNPEEHSVVEVAAVKDGVRVRQNLFQLSARIALRPYAGDGKLDLTR